MNGRVIPEQAPSDAGLLARLNRVEEDGQIWGPSASNVTTCVEDRSLYQKIRDAVHDQYRPRTAYQQILADRIAETIWRAERYASFETTALSHQISLNWPKFENSQIEPTISAHDWFAWLALEGPARKALLEALKLEDRVWRRHRALAAELRTVQKSVREEIIPRKSPGPAPFCPQPQNDSMSSTEIQNEPIAPLTPAALEATPSRAATVTERMTSTKPRGVKTKPPTPSAHANHAERTRSPTRTTTEREWASTIKPQDQEPLDPTEPELAAREASTALTDDTNHAERTHSPTRTTTEREWAPTIKPQDREPPHSTEPELAVREASTALTDDTNHAKQTHSPTRTTTEREWAPTNKPQDSEPPHPAELKPATRTDATRPPTITERQIAKTNPSRFPDDRQTSRRPHSLHVRRLCRVAPMPRPPRRHSSPRLSCSQERH